MRKLLEQHMFSAMRVALIVGSVLLLINQFDAVLGDEHLRVLPAVLTYCVPFCVFLLGKRSCKCDDPSPGVGVFGNQR